jgi:hypothetical protein
MVKIPDAFQLIVMLLPLGVTLPSHQAINLALASAALYL